MEEGRPLDEARILVVDDEPPNVRLLQRLLEQAGYVNVEATIDSRRVAGLLTGFEPDLILLDLLMPHLDGFEVMDQLTRLVPSSTYLPILVLTADDTAETKRKALARGRRTPSANRSTWRRSSSGFATYWRFDSFTCNFGSRTRSWKSGSEFGLWSSSGLSRRSDWPRSGCASWMN